MITPRSLLEHRLWGSHSDVPAVLCHPPQSPVYAKKEANLCVKVKCRVVASGAIGIKKVNTLVLGVGRGGGVTSLPSFLAVFGGGDRYF